MRELHELARYSLIAGYYAYLKPTGSVMDVGCGEGILQHHLVPFGYRYYLGIDLSQTALAMAAAHADGRTEFRYADVESWKPDRKFDVIIFNEMLYYCSNPFDVVRRLADSLEPDGIMIASMWSSPPGRRKAAQIWRAITSIAEIVDSTTARNREAWTINVFRLKVACSSETT
jgi:2-polyprenyl-3-methyl-5-hydroxy-6-metoxy-1,4-benzoquinol methylase